MLSTITFWLFQYFDIQMILFLKNIKKTIKINKFLIKITRNSSVFYEFSNEIGSTHRSCDNRFFSSAKEKQNSDKQSFLLWWMLVYFESKRPLNTNSLGENVEWGVTLTFVSPARCNRSQDIHQILWNSFVSFKWQLDALHISKVTIFANPKWSMKWQLNSNSSRLLEITKNFIQFKEQMNSSQFNFARI